MMSQMASASNDFRLSKSLSYLLRHGAKKAGLSFDDGGFIDVETILKLPQHVTYTVSDIKRVVNNNDKKRFSLRFKDGDPNRLQIRANQGHTLEISEDGLLTELKEGTVPSLIYHGTYLKHLRSIREQGLSRMKRNHVHFTSKHPSNERVISGVRKNCEVYLVIDALAAIKNGIKFYVSENEVVLSPGNEDGVIPALFIKEIWQLNPSKKLF